MDVCPKNQQVTLTVTSVKKHKSYDSLLREPPHQALTCRAVIIQGNVL